MIVITIITVVPDVRGVKSAHMDTSQIVNSALNQSVRVTPAQATCGFRSNDTALNSENEAVPCAYGCARRFPVHDKSWMFPRGIEQIGGHRCHMSVRENHVSAYMCYVHGRIPGMADEYTYTVWIKPTDTHTEQ